MSLDFDQLVLAPSVASFGEVNRGFAIPVYTPFGGSAFSIDGIFRIPEGPVLGIDNEPPPLMTRMPMLDLRVSQFPAGVVAAQGDNIVVRGVSYTISDAAFDGDGLVCCSLREFQAMSPPPPIPPLIELGAATSYTLANGVTFGQEVTIADNLGLAGGQNKTVLGIFDTGASLVLSQNFQTYDLSWDGTQWVVS